MEMAPVTQRFVLHWGEMGARWGINRTVAQIHALLYLSPKPLNAEEIAETLGVARSNVSNSLKELQGWGIVRVVHVMGDRRDHFESMKDVWEMFRTILDERKKRETDPTLNLLRECFAEAKKGGSADAVARERLGNMLDFFETMTAWYESTRKIPTPAVLKLCRMGDKVAKLLGVG
ncbi:MAG TPA: GbsR/MarR family transcriptional regulator [Tepidisphaeraceae bacterium]|jgi:DNA-binding transcriptional regulator GbsR (MarR family)